jgi:hypothetical protein
MAPTVASGERPEKKRNEPQVALVQAMQLIASSHAQMGSLQSCNARLAATHGELTAREAPPMIN